MGKMKRYTWLFLAALPELVLLPFPAQAQKADINSLVVAEMERLAIPGLASLSTNF